MALVAQRSEKACLRDTFRLMLNSTEKLHAKLLSKNTTCSEENSYKQPEAKRKKRIKLLNPYRNCLSATLTPCCFEYSVSEHSQPAKGSDFSSLSCKFVLPTWGATSGMAHPIPGCPALETRWQPGASPAQGHRDGPGAERRPWHKSGGWEIWERAGSTHLT